MHEDDVAVLDSGDDAQFPILVFRVLEHFFHGHDLVVLLVSGLNGVVSTR